MRANFADCFRKMIAVYTKTGDLGETSLLGGKRILKSDPQVEACGSLDELNSFAGMVISKLRKEGVGRRGLEVREFLVAIQRDLYKMMSFLAGAKVSKEEEKNLKSEVKKMEEAIDILEKKLPKPNKFILPTGSEVSAWFHILRTITRRAERAVVRFFSSQTPATRHQTPILMYLNRLSDLFFMLARKYNQEEELLYS